MIESPAKDVRALAAAPSRSLVHRRRRTDFFFSLASAGADLAAVPLAFLVAHLVRFNDNLFRVDQHQPWSDYWPLALLQGAVVVLVCTAQGLYRPRRPSWLDELYRVFVAVSVATAIVSAVGAVVWSDYNFSRLVLALAWLLGVVFVATAHQSLRLLNGWLRARGLGGETVLIAGTNETSRRVLAALRSARSLGYHPVGFVSETGETEFEGLPVLGGLASIGSAVRLHQVDKVIIAVPGLTNAELEELIGRCAGADAAIRIYPEQFHLMSNAARLEDVGGLPLVTVREIRLKGHNIVLKRLLDLVGSAVGLVLLSPLLLLCAVLVKLTSPGPAFFIQERVGLDGRPFKLIKFRTMRVDAESETGPVWTTPDDPRRTRFGAFLRRYSIDELPQLINVLLGEMSLVGPRPERPHFVEQFRLVVPRYYERHHEKAGITGWAQVNGLRGQCSIEERTAYDLWYVENWTLWLDIKILVKSVVMIFSDPNAY